MVSAKLREIAGPIMVIVLVAFICTIFVSWGMGGLDKKKHLAGSINGKDVPIEFFNRAVENERMRIQQEVSDQQQASQQLKIVPRQIWERQVQEQLMTEIFDKLKLNATADEIYTHLKNNPPRGLDTASYFKTDGVFDTTKYIQFLNNPASFDDPGMRYQEMYTQKFIVPTQKLEALLNASLKPTLVELEKKYREENEKAVIEYASVTNSDFSVDSSKITEGMISDYYTQNTDSFASPEMADLYFVAIPKEPTARDEKIFYEDMLKIKERIQEEGALFEDEARLESDDKGSAEKGGDLGWFGRGMMVPEFDKTVFSMKVGTISDPVKSQFGYHLIQLEDKRTKDGKVEVKARHILRKIVPTLETIDSLEALGDTILVRAKENGLYEAAKDIPTVRYDSTGLFPKDQQPPKIGFVSGLNRFVFDSEVGSIPDQVYRSNEDALYIVQIKNRTPAGTMPYETVKEQIRSTLITAEQKEMAEKYLETALSTLSDDASLASLGESDSLITSGVSDTVNAMGYIEGIGYQNEAVAVAFALPADTRSKAVKINTGFCAVKPVWKSTIDTIDWNSPDIARIKQTYILQKRQRAFYNWYLAAKEDAEIVDNLSMYYAE